MLPLDFWCRPNLPELTKLDNIDQYSITIYMFYVNESIQHSSWEQCSCVQEEFFGILCEPRFGARLVCLYRDPQVRTYPWVTPSLDSLDLYYQEDHTLSSFAVGAAFRGFRDCYKEMGLKLVKLRKWNQLPSK